MAGRARAQMGLPDAPDNSWMKHVRCEVCNRRICVNNYPDRKVRLAEVQVRGVNLCGWCGFHTSAGYVKGDGGDFVTALFVFTRQVSSKPCIHRYLADSEFEGTTVDCGKCPPCVARKVMAKSPRAKAMARKAEREAHGK